MSVSVAVLGVSASLLFPFTTLAAPFSCLCYATTDPTKINSSTCTFIPVNAPADCATSCPAGTVNGISTPVPPRSNNDILAYNECAKAPPPPAAPAAPITPPAASPGTPATVRTSLPTAVTLDNPLGVKDFNQAIGKVISAALGLSGAIALLMFVWGGIQWLISAGNADRVKAGKSTLTWAALGIVVIFTAYTLVNVVVQALAGVSA